MRPTNDGLFKASQKTNAVGKAICWVSSVMLMD
jgi:hypothetical protein